MDPSPVKDGERPYASLGRREQIARLRDLARAALVGYGLGDARLTLLRHEHNTTFRVDGGGATSVLRINRPGVHAPATIASEMAWLQALRRDTGLGVPEPVAARDGALAVLAHAPGMPGPRVCVLVRHQSGASSTSVSPRRTCERGPPDGGAAGARRPLGAAGGLRPAARRHLTTAAKAAGIASAPAPPWHGEQPTREDADRCLQLVTELFTVADAAVLAAALDVVWATTRCSPRSRDGRPDPRRPPPGELPLRTRHRPGDRLRRLRLGLLPPRRRGDAVGARGPSAVRGAARRAARRVRRPAFAAGERGRRSRRARDPPPDPVAHLGVESRGHAAFRDDWRTRAREHLDVLATGVAAR